MSRLVWSDSGTHPFVLGEFSQDQLPLIHRLALDETPVVVFPYIDLNRILPDHPWARTANRYCAVVATLRFPVSESSPAHFLP